jgi:protein gp37
LSKTKISWTDYTWNPVVGCQKVSEGCRWCYAKTLHDQRHKAYLEGKKLPKQYAKPFEEIQLIESRLDYPLYLKKPSMIFVNSMSDLFHEKVPFEFIDKVFNAIAESPGDIFQILTKRPERALKYFNTLEYSFEDTLCYKNTWLGVSVEDQKTADERIPNLLKIPAAVRWLSVEPMLGKIDIRQIDVSDEDGEYLLFPLFPIAGGGIDWVVVGCESGAKRRPCKQEWIESIVNQCKQANVPVFVKQMEINGKVCKDINLFPKHLQVREYPNE